MERCRAQRILLPVTMQPTVCHVLPCVLRPRLECVNFKGKSATGELSLCDYSPLGIQALFLQHGQWEINEVERKHGCSALVDAHLSLLLPAWACHLQPSCPRLLHLPSTESPSFTGKVLLLEMKPFDVNTRNKNLIGVKRSISKAPSPSVELLTEAVVLCSLMPGEQLWLLTHKWFTKSYF